MTSRAKMKTVGGLLVAAMALAPLSACDKDGEGGSEGQSEAAALVDAVLELEAGGVTPAVTVSLQMPGNWQAHDFFENAWLPEGVNSPMETGLTFETTCGGACDAAQIAANIESGMAVPALTERWAQGSDELHFQPTIEIIETGDLAHGRFVAYRVTYPDPPAGSTFNPNASTRLECFLQNEGDAFYVVLEAIADPEYEAAVWPALRESCQGASYTTATP